ncbi:MAG: hypothetical protein P8X52_11855 [Limibacillus sp.]
MSAQRFLPDLKKWFESPPPEADLPQRVRQSIRENQDQSEMMIGWIQFTVVSIMGVLYLLSPKTFTEDAQFAPVPWALGIYLGLTVIRLTPRSCANWRVAGKHVSGARLPERMFWRKKSSICL